MRNPRACATAHAFLSMIRSRFPCVSPQMAGQMYDVFTIITPCFAFYKSESEKDRIFFSYLAPFLIASQDSWYYESKAIPKEKQQLQKHYQLPASFSLQRRVMENQKDENLVYYRYATVYRLKDIQALQK